MVIRWMSACMSSGHQTSLAGSNLACMSVPSPTSICTLLATPASRFMWSRYWSLSCAITAGQITVLLSAAAENPLIKTCFILVSLPNSGAIHACAFIVPTSGCYLKHGDAQQVCLYPESERAEYGGACCERVHYSAPPQETDSDVHRRPTVGSHQ